MASRVSVDAEALFRPIVENMGYVLVEVEYKKEYTGMILSVVIDQDGGVNLSDCEKVSRALDSVLDEHDITNGDSYSFNVSSYGLDRQFKTDYDFNKHIGKKVTIKFYSPYMDTKSMEAVLVAHSDKSITVTDGNENIEIEKSKIASICAVIEF